MSYKFNASNFLTFTDADYRIVGDLTVACWANWSGSFGSSNVLVCHGGNYSPATNADNIVYALNVLLAGGGVGPDRVLRAEWRPNSPGGSEAIDSDAFNPEFNRWYHVGYSRDAAAKLVRFYVDGAILGSAVSYTNNAGGGENGRLVIGHSAASAGGINGWIAGVGIWSSVRTAAEIADLALGKSPGLISAEPVTGTLKANIPLLKTPFLRLEA